MRSYGYQWCICYINGASHGRMLSASNTSLPHGSWSHPQALAAHQSTGKRPSQRSGICGLYGAPVDVLDLCRKEMLDLQDRVRAARKRAMAEGSTPSW